MTSGQSLAEINECCKILRHLGMLSEYVAYPTYPDSPQAYFKGLSYPDVWKKCLQNRFYHFQLFDDSLIHYVNKSGKSRNLCYLEFPYESMTYVEFLNLYGYSYDETGESLRHEYDDYLTTCDHKESISNIRYDLDCSQYVQGVHPASHLHIGYCSNIRIRTEGIMGPLAFLMFVIRQHYPAYWNIFLESKDKEWMRNAVRDNLKTVESKYVTDLDRCEIFLK